jgi:hypothetical protein
VNRLGLDAVSYSSMTRYMCDAAFASSNPVRMRLFTVASDQFQGDDVLMAATFFRNLIDLDLR